MIKNKPLIFLLLTALFLRLTWFFFTDNLGYGDAAARLNITQLWLYSYWKIPSVVYLQILNPSLDWLPLHFYILGFVSYIFNDMTYTPRLITLIVSTLTIIPLYKIACLKFNEKTAIIASVILAFYGVHIFISSLTLSEPFYCFFLLWGYWFLEKHFASQKTNTSYLIGLSVCIAACTLLRYEGWVLCCVFVCTFPLLKRITFKNYFLFTCLPVFAIAFIMLCEIAQGQHPLRGILFSDFEVSITKQLHGIDFSYLLPGLLPLYAIALIHAIIQYVRNKENRSSLILLALYYLPVLPFLVKSIDGSVTAQARYLTLYMIPAIVFIASFINSVFTRYKLKKSTQALLLFCYVFAANISLAQQISTHRLKVKYPSGFWQSAYYFKDKIKLSRAYIDYGLELSNCNWMVYANTFDAIHSVAEIDTMARQLKVDGTLFKARALKGARYRITGHEYEWNTWKSGSFDTLLIRGEISHIVLFPDGLLANHLNINNKNTYIYLNMRFTKLFSKDEYCIYRIDSI